MEYSGSNIQSPVSTELPEARGFSWVGGGEQPRLAPADPTDCRILPTSRTSIVGANMQTSVASIMKTVLHSSTGRRP